LARERKTKSDKGASAKGEISPDVGLSSLNIKLLVLSFLIIVAGFIFLSRGSITLAPILLVLGYCVMVPVAIIYKPKSAEEKTSKEKTSKKD